MTNFANPLMLSSSNFNSESKVIPSSYSLRLDVICTCQKELLIVY